MSGNKKSYEQIRQEVAQNVKMEEQKKAAANVAANSTGTRKSYEQIRREVAQKHGVTLQPSTQKAPTMRELADQSEWEYQNYLGSTENLQARQTAFQQYNAEHKWDGLKNALANPLGGGSVGLSSVQYGVDVTDPKEQELKAKADYYKVQAQLEADNAVLEAHRKEWESWSAADRAALELYTYNRLGSLGNIAQTVSAISSGSGTQQGQAAIRAGQVNAAYEQLAKKYGADRVKQLAESYERYQNRQTAEEVTAGAREAASGDGTTEGKWGAGALHSGLSVGANLVNAMTGPVGVLSELSHRTGQYSTLDPNNAGNIFGTYAGAVRGQVAENISGDKHDANGNKVSDGGWVRQAGATLYEAGMSAADSLARIFASGGNEALSLGLAATGSFSQTVSQASKQGANPVQAVAMGIVDGGLEVLTEKVSLDNLLKQAAAGPKSFKAVLKGILKSGAIEVSEEEMSFLGSTLLEAAILREKSSYNQRVGALMAKGNPYAEAVAAADKELLEEAVNTAVTSFLSGGMMGGGAQVVSAIRTGQIGKEFGKLDLDKGDIQDLIDSGLESAEDTESHQIATEIKKQIDEGKTPSNYELARLWQANRQAIDAENAERPDGEEENMNNPPAVAAEGGGVTQNGKSVINQGQNVTAAGSSVTEDTGNVTRAPMSIAEQIRQNKLNQGGIINGTERIAGTAGSAGAGVLSGSGQRPDGQSAGEQAGSLADGAGKAALRKETAERNAAAVGRINRIRSLRLPTVSTKELGLSSGTESRSVRVVPEEHWDPEMQQLAERVYQETGKTVSYVTGRIQIKGADRRVRNVNGAVYGDKIVVRVDSLHLSMEQIADHEAYHGRVTQADAWRPGWLNQEIRRHIVENFSQEEFEAVAQKYVEAMAGIYDMDEGLSEGEYQKLLAKIQEEVFADAYAGINAFGAGADRFTSAVNEKMEQIGLGRYQAEEQANGVRETAGPPSGERFSVNTDYASEVEAWAKTGMDPEQQFVLGSTGDVLQGLGAIESDIYMQGDKIAKILRDHPEMSLDIIKKIPQIVDDPALVLKSKNVKNLPRNTRLVMFGSVKADNGQPVLCVLDLRPVENRLVIDDMQKVTSAYTKDDPASFVQNSDVLYADKKRTAKLLRTIGLHRPIELQRSGYIGSISYIGQNVNIAGVPFTEIIREVEPGTEDISDEEFQERYGLKLRAVDEDTAPGGERFSFAGENARTANSQTLGEAKGLEQMGVDAESIRQETGWFRGKDGKWRFEVDDSTAQLADEIINYMTLGELLPGAEIFKAYPNLEDVSVVFQSLEPGVNASYDPRFDSIDVDYKLKSDPEAIRAAVLHEVQHVIQRWEGFSKGTNVRAWERKIRDGFDSRKASDIREAAEAERQLERFRMEEPDLYRDMMELDAMTPDLPRGAVNWDTLEQIEEDPPEWQTYDARRDQLEEIYGDRMWDFYSALHDMQRINKRMPRTAEELYWDTAGEIEARNVAGRRNLTAEQRKKTPPILGGEDTVFVEGGWINDSHRIVLPDGTVFRFGGEKNNDAVREPHRGVPTEGSLANATSTASIDRVAENEVNVKANSDVRYSVDDGTDLTEDDFERVQAALKGQSRDWAENYLRNELGNDGYEQYRAWEKQQAEQKKLENREKAKARNAEKQAARKSVKDPVAESKPIRAKRELRQTVLDLFSIPEGSRAELGAMIDSYADRLLKNGSLTEEDRKHFFDRMYDAGVMTVPAEDYFSQGRDILKGGRVYVPESVRFDFGDDWNEIRRRAFGARIYLTSDPNAGGIDTWNHELAEELPGLFDSEETDLRSILERIVEIAEEGQDNKMSLSEFTAMMAGRGDIRADEFLDHMERQMDWALRTFAEKARLEISLRDRTGRQIAKERAVHKETAQRQQARKELRQLQEKTLKTLRWLNQNRNRAPEELQVAWDEVLGDIDLYAIGAADEMRWSNRYGATWKDLAQMYKDAQTHDPNFLPSKELEMIVGRLDGTKIEEMDLGALNDLYKAAIGLRTEFYNRNNVVNDEMNRLFAEVYRDAKDEIEAAPGGYSGKAMDKLMNLEQLTPMNVLQRMGGWDPNGAFYSMAKQLEKGERDMRAYSVKAQKMLQEFLTENADWVKKADGQGKDGIWYEVEIPELVALELGKKPEFGATIKVSMTPAQKVHLYLESKNVDNLRHMTGGRTFADKKLYSEGKRQEALAQGKTVRMAPETVKALVSDLTEQEMELARLLEQYYNSFATGEINRISNILYGYDKAMGKNYAPIYTNRNYTKTEFGVFDQTAEGVGNLKGRQYAVNPSYNISAFDAFERHVDQTARFVGMAIPARNWTTLMNWREKNNSTGDVITHKWGEEGKKYITDLINTLQAGESIKTDAISSAVSKLQSTYITAIFGANPSIVLKQLGSIPLASAYLDAQNVPTPAQIKSIDRELIGKYTQDLAWRTMGYSTPETRQLKENPNWTETNKFYKFAFGGGAITAMDGWAASVLWPWAENKVRRDYPELEMGTPEQIDKGESPFYKKVAELFEDALARSQSTSDEIHQSSLRKSKNPVTKAFTMFRSDAAQTYNTLRQKIGEAQYFARTGAKSMVQEAAKKAVGAAVVSLLLNAIWAESINFLMALWKNKGKYYRDDEEELTFTSVAGEMVSGMLGSFAGIVTGGEEAFEVIGNLLTGKKIYDIETPGIEQLNDLITSVTAAGSSMRDVIAGAANVAVNGGDVGRYFSQNSGKILGSIKDVAETTVMYIPGLPVSGLPVSNIEGYLMGAVKWLSPALGEAYDNLFRDTDKNDLTGAEGNTLRARVGQILRSRKVSKSGETAEILASLYEAGHKAAVPSNTPGSVTVKGEKHTLNEYQKQTYETVWNSIVGDALDDIVESSRFRNADEKKKTQIISKLYDYAAESAKSELFDDYEVESATGKIMQINKSGLDLAECIAWSVESSGMKQAEKFWLLRHWNMTDDAKKTIVGTLIGTEMKTETGKDSKYAKMLEALKSGVTIDEYLDMCLDGTEIEDYLELIEEGMDSDTAYELLDYVSDLELKKEDLSKIETWKLRVNFSTKPHVQLAALAGVMSKDEFAKVNILFDFGVEPEAFVKYHEICNQFDANRNGSFTYAEVEAAVNSINGLTRQQKAALWQMVSGSKNGNRNPFDRAIGKQVVDAKLANG